MDFIYERSISQCTTTWGIILIVPVLIPMVLHASIGEDHKSNANLYYTYKDKIVTMSLLSIVAYGILSRQMSLLIYPLYVHSFPHGRNGPHFGRQNFQLLFLEQKWWNSDQISLNYEPRSSSDNKPALFQVMFGAKPLPGPMMTKCIDGYRRL